MNRAKAKSCNDTAAEDDDHLEFRLDRWNEKIKETYTPIAFVARHLGTKEEAFAARGKCIGNLSGLAPPAPKRSGPAKISRQSRFLSSITNNSIRVTQNCIVPYVGIRMILRASK